MKRRQLILLLGGASSGAMSVGTGAFSSVEAERNVEVSVVEDENAYLGLEQVADSVTVGDETKVVRIQNQFATPLDLSVVVKEVNKSIGGINVDGHDLSQGDEADVTLSSGDSVYILVACRESGEEIPFRLRFDGNAGEASVDKTRKFEITCEEEEEVEREEEDEEAEEAEVEKEEEDEEAEDEE